MAQMIEFEMSEADYAELLAACRPTPAMYLSGGMRMTASPQENANAAWVRLGKKMGFNGMSVRPSRRGPRFFFAMQDAVAEAAK